MADLGRIHPGDIVEVNVRGRIAMAFAQKREGREMGIEPITPGFNYHRVTGRQVTRHWRQTRNQRRVVERAGHDA